MDRVVDQPPSKIMLQALRWKAGELCAEGSSIPAADFVARSDAGQATSEEYEATLQALLASDRHNQNMILSEYVARHEEKGAGHAR